MLSLRETLGYQEQKPSCTSMICAPGINLAIVIHDGPSGNESIELKLCPSSSSAQGTSWTRWTGRANPSPLGPPPKNLFLFPGHQAIAKRAAGNLTPHRRQEAEKCAPRGFSRPDSDGLPSAPLPEWSSSAPGSHSRNPSSMTSHKQNVRMQAPYSDGLMPE
jgi:hypothetical protein